MIIRALQTGTSTDTLATRKFNQQPRPALVSLWIAGLTDGDTFGFSVGSQDFAVQGTRMNVRSAAGVLDTKRDQMLMRETVPAGQYFLPIACTTSVEFLLVIEPM